jgi:hypothetical protein
MAKRSRLESCEHHILLPEMAGARDEEDQAEKNPKGPVRCRPHSLEIQHAASPFHARLIQSCDQGRVAASVATRGQSDSRSGNQAVSQ